MSCFLPCINLWGSVSLLNLPCVFAMCEGFWENNSFCHRKYLKDTHGKNGTTYQEKPRELETWVLQIDFKILVFCSTSFLNSRLPQSNFSCLDGQGSCEDLRS